MITIRRIQIGEADLFRQIRLMALRDAPYAFSTTYASALARSDESWRKQADSAAHGSDRATFIAFFRDSPIGIAALYRGMEALDEGEILQVWVAPEYRGQKVAQALMDAVFRWARENAFRKIIATLKKENTRALRFYQSYSFHLMDGTSLDDPADPILIKKIQQGSTAECTLSAGISE